MFEGCGCIGALLALVLGFAMFALLAALFWPGADWLGADWLGELTLGCSGSYPACWAGGSGWSE